MGLSQVPAPTVVAPKVWNLYDTSNITSATNYTDNTRPAEPTTKVYYLNSTFVFGTANGWICYSTNSGLTWTWNRIFPTAVRVTAIAYNGTNWIVVGENRYCYSASSLGGTWTSRTTPFAAGVTINDAVWVSGSINLFVAVANNSGTSSVIATSPDGITWTSRSSQAYQAKIIAVNTAQNMLCVGTTSTTAGVQGLYSSDATSWSALNIVNGGTTPATGSLFYYPHADRFVSYNNAGMRSTATISSSAWNLQTPQPKFIYPTELILQANNASYWGDPICKKFFPIWDSTNQKYYAVDWNQQVGTVFSLYTFGNADRLTSSDVAGGNTYYALARSRVDAIGTHINNQTTNSITPDLLKAPALGYGNNTWVVVLASVDSSSSYMPEIYVATV